MGEILWASRNPLRHGAPVGDDQRCHVRLALADDDSLLDQVVALDLELELLRGDVLAPRGLDEVLLAVRDLEEAVRVELADVTGADPPVVQHLRGRDRVVVIAEHVAGAVDQDLAVLRQLQLDARERLADGEEAVLRERVRANAG